MFINKKNNLFLILFDVFTLIVWSWLVIEFITKEKIVLPELISTLYLLILASYVGNKEIKRGQKRYFPRWRKGEYFVYLWGLTLVIIVAWYIWGGNRLGYLIPRELPVVAGSVLILYIFTEYHKGSGQKRRMRN